jgi:ubiquinone/menaquinone biosynthesis C-methylase UbiE
MTSESDHAERIRDQFTKQAEPFAAFRIHRQETSLEWLREGLRLRGGERVLDAGCGPGLVASHLAPHAREVVGIDATKAMVEKARELAAEGGSTNLAFVEGTMERLPFEDDAFDGVVTRYTIHHVRDAEAVMAELVRVARPGGRVVVCDAAPRAECRDAYDTWERLRDPSHTSARTLEELRRLAEGALRDVEMRAFRLEAEVDALVASSFPEPGDREVLIEQMRADVGVDALDMDARLVDGRLWMSFPIVVMAGTVARSA